MSTIDTASMPRFLPGVRLHHDQTRGQWVILAPERVIELDDIAHAIVGLCDGQRSVQVIVETLATEFDAEATEVSGDVLALIDDLIGKRVLRL
jgi:pyrroloquinoline quinone biosynthesis protein D